MSGPMPIYFDAGAVAELSDIARDAAARAGAEGAQLDIVASGIFRVLAAHVNRLCVQ